MDVHPTEADRAIMAWARREWLLVLLEAVMATDHEARKFGAALCSTDERDFVSRTVSAVQFGREISNDDADRIVELFRRSGESNYVSAGPGQWRRIREIECALRRHGAYGIGSTCALLLRNHA